MNHKQKIPQGNATVHCYECCYNNVCSKIFKKRTIVSISVDYQQYITCLIQGSDIQNYKFRVVHDCVQFLNSLNNFVHCFVRVLSKLPKYLKNIFNEKIKYL